MSGLAARPCSSLPNFCPRLGLGAGPCNATLSDRLLLGGARLVEIALPEHELRLVGDATDRRLLAEMQDLRLLRVEFRPLGEAVGVGVGAGGEIERIAGGVVGEFGVGGGARQGGGSER